MRKRRLRSSSRCSQNVIWWAFGSSLMAALLQTRGYGVSGRRRRVGFGARGVQRLFVDQVVRQHAVSIDAFGGVLARGVGVDHFPVRVLDVGFLGDVPGAI